MLKVTESAASAIRTIAASTDQAEDSGLRIDADTSADDSYAYAVSLTTGPQPNDAVLESEGARVFVADEVAPALEHKALDAEVDQNGKLLFHLVDEELM